MTTVGNQRGIAVYSRGIIGCSIGRVPGTVRVTDGRIVTRPAECDRIDGSLAVLPRASLGPTSSS